ncbi:hypothetical protein OQA88_1506 [Cercophora sp. LCS_1]
MFPAKFLSAAWTVLLVRPVQAAVVEVAVRQDLPEGREGRDRDAGWQPIPPWMSLRVPPVPALTLWPPVLTRSLSPLLPRPLPTVVVTTQISVTINPTTDKPTATSPSDPEADNPSAPTPDTPSDGFPPGGGPGLGTASETRQTEMPTSSRAFPTTTGSGEVAGSSGSSPNSGGLNRTVVIILSTVLSVVGVLLIIVAVLICRRYRRGRFPFFSRGVSPIDDDEIATWKVPRGEKGLLPGSDIAAAGGAVGATAAAAGAVGPRGSNDSSNNSHGPSHARNTSSVSVKKPPSVIVYANPHGYGGYRHSTDDSSPCSFVSAETGPISGLGHRMSFDKTLPQTPIQAKAPNARVGLTDESIPGDDPFVSSPKHHQSRLSKLPPGFSSSHRRHHLRTKSSRSSTRSFGDYAYSGSDLGLSQRHSHDYIPRTHQNGHWRVYSSSSIPPRLSFSDESVFNGGLSPRPLLADQEIGRAIG